MSTYRERDWDEWDEASDIRAQQDEAAEAWRQEVSSSRNEHWLDMDDSRRPTRIELDLDEREANR